jgi:hypothetical protein
VVVLVVVVAEELLELLEPVEGMALLVLVSVADAPPAMPVLDGAEDVRVAALESESPVVPVGAADVPVGCVSASPATGAGAFSTRLVAPPLRPAA